MTNAEIIKALRICANQTCCDNCPRYDIDHTQDAQRCCIQLINDAADALEAADERIAELEKQLPKEGEWLRTDAFPHRIYCSVCYKTYVPNDRWQIWVDDELPKNYCPNCGAKMQTVTNCHALEEENDEQ